MEIIYPIAAPTAQPSLLIDTADASVAMDPDRLAGPLMDVRDERATLIGGPRQISNAVVDAVPAANTAGWTRPVATTSFVRPSRLRGYAQEFLV